MCGIFGWALKPNTDPQKLAVLAAVLAVKNDERGGDSWGFYTAGTISRGMGDLGPEAWRLKDHHRMMAHTRAASTGKVLLKNAHPFEIGGIIGAHNGCLSNWQEMNKKYNRAFEVDSQHIIAHLAEGLDVSELRGWGTLEWVRRDDPSATLLCKLSSNGALSVARSPEGIVWSSAEPHLEVALAAAQLSNRLIEVIPHMVYVVQDYEIYTTDATLKLGEYNIVPASHTAAIPGNWTWMVTDDTPAHGAVIPSDPLELQDELFMAENELRDLQDKYLQCTSYEEQEDTAEEIELQERYIDQLKMDLGALQHDYCNVGSKKQKRTRRNPEMDVANPRLLFR